jgi:formylglycine-generating enzyme required for sulfatase activity
MMLFAKKVLLFEFIFFSLSCTQDTKFKNKKLTEHAESVETSSIKKENLLETKSSPCPDDMKHVVGDMLTGSPDYVEIVQDSTCVKWLNKEYPARCADFDQKLWEKEKKKLARTKMNFCIDTYEWPNKVNVNPSVFIDWVHASEMCSAVGKRLCSEDEWTFACEGEEGLPYPYGYSRDSSACNIDKSWIKVDEEKLNSSDSQGELNKLWQGVPSGSMTKCVSPFGVHDMTGNVDEWTASSRRSGYKSILKGGYWSVVRNRCRPSTRSHNEWHRYYQQGFRCCKMSN